MGARWTAADVGDPSGRTVVVTGAASERAAAAMAAGHGIQAIGPLRPGLPG